MPDASEADQRVPGAAFCLELQGFLNRDSYPSALRLGRLGRSWAVGFDTPPDLAVNLIDTWLWL